MRKTFFSFLVLILSFQIGFFGTIFPVRAMTLEERAQQINRFIELEESQGIAPRELLVKFKSGAVNTSSEIGKTQLVEFAENNSLLIQNDDVLSELNSARFTIDDTVSVEDAVTELSKNSLVEYVQPNFQYEPSAITNDPFISDLWAIDASHNPSFAGYQSTSASDMDVNAAWQKFSQETETIVAVIDSGVDYTHEDLQSVMWNASGENACKDYEGNLIFSGCPNHGWYFNGNSSSNDPMPKVSEVNSGHGTHVAGIIAASQNNGKGVAGIGKGIKLMAIKNSLKTSDIVKGIYFAENNGAKIVNASWGDKYINGVYNHIALDRALYESIRDFDGLFVTAAGNDGRNHDSGSFSDVMFPAGFSVNQTVNGTVWSGLKNIITVAALLPNNALPSFSDYGASSIHVAAPGARIKSTYFNGGTNAYTFLDGTSMATPYIAGIAGMLMSYDSAIPAVGVNDSDYSIKNIILSTGDSLASLQGKTLTGKRPNANNAIIYIDNTSVSTVQAGLTFDDIKGNNSSENAITQNLVLPTQGEENTVINWSSNNSSVISASGVVTRPAIGAADAGVTLTATILKNSSVATKSFILVVKALQKLDADIVAEDKNLLTFSNIRGENASADSVTQNLSLPSVGTQGSAISWVSSNAAVINNQGGVLRPVFGQGNASVTLTATISYGQASDSKTFQITVLEQAPNDEEAVNSAKNMLTFSSIKNQNTSEVTIISDLSLPTTLGNNVSVAWISSDISVLTHSGKIIRPVFALGNKTVTLTATLLKNAAQSQQVFELLVLKSPMTDEESILEDKSLLTFENIKQGNSQQDQIISNLKFSSLGSNSSALSWSSSKPEIISNFGVVTQPAFEAGNAEVVVTVTLTKNAVTDSKTFSFTVLKQNPSDEQSVTLAREDLLFEKIRGENVYAHSLTKNLVLPSEGLFGTTLSWSSSNESILSNSGILTRPSFQTGDQMITLAVTIQKGSFSVIKNFALTVLAQEKNAADKVFFDKEALTFDSFKNQNDLAENIKSSLSLPILGQNGSTISWASSNEDIIAQTGKVTRPEKGQNDAQVTLTATIKFDAVQDTKSFVLTVKAWEGMSDLDSVNADKNALIFDAFKNGNADEENIKNNFVLPTTGQNGSTISWASSNQFVVKNTGEVIRPNIGSESVKVTLTATVSKGEELMTKDFEITVLPWLSAPAISGLSIADDLQSDDSTILTFPAIPSGAVSFKYLLADSSAPALESIFEGGVLATASNSLTLKIPHHSNISVYALDAENKVVAFQKLFAVVVPNKTGSIAFDHETAANLATENNIVVRDAFANVKNAIPEIDTIKTLPSLQKNAESNLATIVSKKPLQFTPVENINTGNLDLSPFTEQEKTNFLEKTKNTPVFAQTTVFTAEDRTEAKNQKLFVSLPALSFVQKSGLENIAQFELKNPKLFTSEENTTLASNISSQISNFTPKETVKIDTGSENNVIFTNFKNEAVFADVCLPATLASLSVSSATEVTIAFSSDGTTWKKEDATIKNKQFLGELFCFQTNHFTSFSIGKIASTSSGGSSGSSSGSGSSGGSSSSSSSGGGGGGGGGSSSSTSSTTPYTLTSAESDSVLTIARPLDFSRSGGVVSRPVVLKNEVHGYEVNFSKNTKVQTASGSAFSGTLWYPKTLSATERPETPAGYTLLKSFSFETEDQKTLLFTPAVNISFSLISRDALQSQYVALYRYDADKKGYVFVGGNYDAKTAIFSASLSQTGKFVVLYSESGFTSKSEETVLEAKTETATQTETTTAENMETTQEKMEVHIPDIQKHWAKNSVTELAEKGIISATENFRPNDAITRAEMVKLLAESFGITEQGEKIFEEYQKRNYTYAKFKDVSMNDWFAPFVLACADAEILSEKERFEPAEKVTRAEMVAMLVRANKTEVLGKNTFEEYKKRNYSYAALKDVSMNEWFAPFFLSAYKLGFVSGYSDGTFKPQNTVTRGEAATMIVKAMNE